MKLDLQSVAAAEHMKRERMRDKCMPILLMKFPYYSKMYLFSIHVIFLFL